MENKVDSFGLRHDINTNISKKEAIKQIVMPWASLVAELPLFYFGFIGGLVYVDEFNIILRFFAGLFCGFLLGLFGWCIKSMTYYILLPLMLVFMFSSESFNKKLIYDRKKEVEQEKEMADYVRQYDPYFSIQSFFGGIQNKLSAIHYADSVNEINAFSENNMSPYLERYKNIVDVDFLDIKMESYTTTDTLQKAVVSANLKLLELNKNKIKEKNEKIKMTLVKDINCKSQAVCEASALKCNGCGASISLMEGKKCSYCGHELDYKLYDWAITKYQII